MEIRIDNTRNLWYTTPMPKSKVKIVSHKPKFLPLNRPVKGTVGLQVHFDGYALCDTYDGDTETTVLRDIREELGKPFNKRIMYAGDGGSLDYYYMEWEGKPKDMARLARWFREGDQYPLLAIHTVEIFKI